MCNDYHRGICERDPRRVISRDEVGQLADALDGMRAQLNQLVCQVAQSTSQVAAASQQLTAIAEQSAQAANQVAGTVGNMAAGSENQRRAVMETSQSVEKNIRGHSANC